MTSSTPLDVCAVCGAPCAYVLAWIDLSSAVSVTAGRRWEHLDADLDADHQAEVLA